MLLAKTIIKQICVIYCLFALKIVCTALTVGSVLNKCCSMEQTFDADRQDCTDGNISNEFEFRQRTLVCKDVVIETESGNLDELLTMISNEDYCVDGSEGFWILRMCAARSVCTKDMPCVHKCCRSGQKYNGSSKCVDHLGTVKPVFHSLAPVLTEINVTQFGTIQENPCMKYMLDPVINDVDIHYFNHIDGTLKLKDRQDPYRHGEYCIEAVDQGGFLSTETFVCFDTKDPNAYHPFELYGVGMAISAFLFALTAIVYLSIPKLLNLHGKTLVANVLSFCFAYTTLAINSLNREYHSPYFCPIYAYIIYYSLMSGFLWLNVMCFDIWWTFGSIKVSRMKSRESKRFLYYCSYAGSIPFVLTCIMLGLQYGGIGGNLRPRLGEERCWFQIGDMAYNIFFLLPVGLLILINIGLFTLTVIHCNRVKAEIHRMQSIDGDKKKRFIADKARLILNARLFIVMGTSWALEIISTVIKSHLQSLNYMWYISDIFNACMGIFVFIIFVCKRKVWMALKKRVGIKVEQPRNNAGMTDTTSLRPTGKLTKTSSTSTISVYKADNKV